MNSDYSNMFSSPRQPTALSEDEFLMDSLPNHLSIIQHESRFSRSNFSGVDNSEIESFNDLYQYVSNVLNSWGMTLGILRHSVQNTKTVNCLSDLIRIRQKDLEFRSRTQEDIAKIRFEGQTSKAALERTKGQLEAEKKRLGALENRFKAEEAKYKKELQKVLQDKVQLDKVRAKLEQKNSQLMHECKKRQAETNRIKQAVKKASQKGQCKNTFDLTGPLQSNQGVTDNPAVQFLKDKYQYERRTLLKQNMELRTQIEQCAQAVLNFQRWLAEFMHPLQRASMPELHAQHNALVRNLSCTEELEDIIDNVKRIIQERLSSGLQYPRQQRKTVPRMQEQPRRPAILKEQSNTDRKITKPLSTEKYSQYGKKTQPSNQYMKSVQEVYGLAQRPAKEKKQVLNIINPKLSPPVLQVPFHNDQMSMISHISMKDISTVKNTRQFKKWDILFDD